MYQDTGYSGGISANVQAPHASELNREINRHRAASELLLKGVLDLEERLAPVMRGPSPEKVGDAAEEQTNTIIGSSIREATRRIETASRIVTDLAARLEV